MKAITAVCATGAAVPSGIINSSANGGNNSHTNGGRIVRPHRDGENAEIQMYLSKLKDLVPYMPKNKKLSKLEVIQNVIDYICDLQSALETTGGSGSAAAVAAAFDASAVLSGSLSKTVASSTARQPLGVRRSSPNRINRRRQSSQQQQQQQHQLIMTTSSNLSSSGSSSSGGSPNSSASSSPCESMMHTTERNGDWSTT